MSVRSFEVTVRGLIMTVYFDIDNSLALAVKRFQILPTSKCWYLVKKRDKVDKTL